MPFGLWARMGRRNRVRWGSRGAEGRCHGNQFWDAILRLRFSMFACALQMFVLLLLLLLLLL